VFRVELLGVWLLMCYDSWAIDGHFSFVFYRWGVHRDLHLSIRRQRQMCIRDSRYTVNPKTDCVLKPGECFVIIGNSDQLSKLAHDLNVDAA